ncbi:MAG: hypothetical protein AAB116_04750, partial [Candidatus Poribacteria bacterium]
MSSVVNQSIGLRFCCSSRAWVLRYMLYAAVTGGALIYLGSGVTPVAAWLLLVFTTLIPAAAMLADTKLARNVSLEIRLQASFAFVLICVT